MSYIKSSTTAEAGVFLHSVLKNGGGIRVYATWARRREKVFGDRTHPLEEYNDDLVYKKFRLHRQFIFELAEEVSQNIQFSLPRKKVSKSNTRLASASGSAFLRNWKLSKFH